MRLNSAQCNRVLDRRILGCLDYAQVGCLIGATKLAGAIEEHNKRTCGYGS
ncbi:hypothetical protein [Lysinibacillus sp. fls2-241-R2A-57]|uniref:hypothetical protein n=1 Tax=Lysinibacillus sp. fls2-241-R2A-57 TaxID=3040292 RepID=UPI00255482CD|nr:hypothetical protein [Lysinibacillus sp. fls2-241-R2A-57]